MGTSTRKQREVREREQRFLDIARKMLIEHGFAGLSMDRVAEAAEYSKGTVYQHFSTKEDLVTALAVQSNEQRFALFDQARKFAGLPRERMVALSVADELFARLHPHYFHSELVIKMANLEDRASPERREVLQQYDRRCSGLLREIVQAGVDGGDLRLTPPVDVGDVAFAILSQAIGAHTSMLNFRPVLQELGITAPFRSLREHIHTLLDGFGWKPLSTEWDYAETYRRVVREVFADECQSAGLA